ncbi:MAG: peptidyl-prolyl cis-trans isomerase [Deltaproteobacteria bacterium]|nr:peptidyl-prolyl cis-trans isomerase [Deltaproteobacteria bacterium]
MKTTSLVKTLALLGAFALVAGVALAQAPAKAPRGGPDPAAAPPGMLPMAQPEAQKVLTPEEKAKEDARRALPLARVGGQTVTVGDFESALEHQSPLLRKDLGDRAKRAEFLDKLVNMDLLADEAKRRGFDKDDEVIEVRKNQLASLMHQRISEGIKDEEPPEDAVRKYYDDHIDSYVKPEKMRARHILITDKDKAEKLLADVLKKKPSQHEFRRLAQENSEDEATRLRGGDLMFFPRTAERKQDDPEVDPAVAEAAFKLKENGEVSPELIKGAKGYHVVMRTGHRDRMDIPYEEAKPRMAVLVQRDLRKDKVEKAVEEIKGRIKVTVSEENLKDVVIDLSSGPPEPDAPGGLTARERAERQKLLMSGREDPSKVPGLVMPAKKPEGE